jgi:hypothetical protein
MFKNVAERGIYARLFMHAGQQFKSENYQSSYVIYANLAEMGFAIAQANVAELLENGGTFKSIKVIALLNFLRNNNHWRAKPVPACAGILPACSVAGNRLCSC